MDALVGYLNYGLFFATQASIFAILCLGLNLQWGYTGLFNIGVAGFYALGAYTSALLVGPPPTAEDPRIYGGYELPFVVGLLGAMGVSGTVAFLVGIPTLRLRHDYLAIATIGIAEVIRMLLQNEAWLTNGVWGIKHIPAPGQPWVQAWVDGVLAANPDWPGWLNRIVSNAYGWAFLLITVLVLVLIYRVMQALARSPWGRVLKAVREDEVVASFAGKDVFWFKLQSLIVGAMMMGAAGALYAHFARFIDAPTFEPLFGTFIIWVMLIVGGSGNNIGAVVGAFAVWAIWGGADLATSQFGMQGFRAAAVRIFLIAVLLEVVLLYRPRGLMGTQRTITTER